jgi:23S rRNA pseudouridine1911/1915/1917 synthase
VIRFRPLQAETGRRVDVVLAERASVTRTLAQRALRSGDVRVNGAETKPSYRLEPDDVVAGDLPAASIAPPVAEEIPVAVRYSDDRVLVVSKPSGLVTHPARGHEGGTLVNALLGLGGPLAGMGSTRPGIVHRLDKDTSGLLLIARDDEAQAYLVDAMQRRAVERRYLALVRGAPPAASGTIEAPVGRHPVKRRQMAVVSGGRPSVTHYTVLSGAPGGGGVTLLEARLETGRTHQIRVHLSHLGVPVLGDQTYGGASELAHALGLRRPFLHAWRLAFPHPSTGAPVEVRDPLPEDLTEALGRAGLEAPEP